MNKINSQPVSVLQQVHERVHYFAHCPYSHADASGRLVQCAGEWDITRLVRANRNKERVGPWACPVCQWESSLEVMIAQLGHGNAKVTVKATATGKQVLRTLDLLQFRGCTAGDHPLYLVAEGYAWRGMDGVVTFDNEYWYDEHACPFNYLRATVMIGAGEDCDPHGIFCLVETVLKPAHWEHSDTALSQVEKAEILRLFPSLGAAASTGTRAIVVPPGRLGTPSTNQVTKAGAIMVQPEEPH